MKTRVLILGSTGSIGTQALEVVEHAPERFDVVGLSAGGGNVDALCAQVAATRVSYVAVADEAAATVVAARLPEVTVFRGETAAADLVNTVECDVVLNGIVGSRGLLPTLAGLKHGRTLALANKESLVAGEKLVLQAAAPGQLIPVDSEHSAMAQCLRAGTSKEVDRLVLTASGGPFRGKRRDELRNVTAEQAGKHPTWAMGPLITLNSATLVNKALELIEAHLLFDVPYDNIDVTVHPQSIVHSMVTFTDGATVAKASPPSMKLPIALAMAWPDRVPNVSTPLDFTQSFSWDFQPVDNEVFPAIELARQAGQAGGLMTAVYNAANEEAADAFFAEKIGFLDIVDTIDAVIQAGGQWTQSPESYEHVLEAETWARHTAHSVMAGRQTH